MKPKKAVAVADLVIASGWCEALAARGISVSLETQVEAEVESLRNSGVELFLAVDARDPAVKAWATALDNAAARARQLTQAEAALSD